jgi:predicted small lipoprotein YifL
MLDSGPNSNGRIMRLLILLLVLVGLLFALTACGKKGDLYLPDAPTKPLHSQSDQ